MLRSLICCPKAPKSRKVRDIVNVKVLGIVASFSLVLFLSGCRPHTGSKTASGQASSAINPLTLEGAAIPPDAREIAIRFINPWYAQCGDKFVTNLPLGKIADNRPNNYSMSGRSTEEIDVISEVSSMTVEITNTNVDIDEADKLNGINSKKHISIFWILGGPYRKASFKGSWQESGKVCVLRGFLKSDEFGSRGGHPLRFQQQVVEVAVTASAAQKRFDVAVDSLHHSQFDLGPTVVQYSLQVIDQHVRQLLHGL